MDLSAAVVPQADEVLDIYHAIEHLAYAAKALWGEGTLAMQQLWTRVVTSCFRKARRALDSEGLGMTAKRLIEPEGLVQLRTWQSNDPFKVEANLLAVSQAFGLG